MSLIATDTTICVDLYENSSVHITGASSLNFYGNHLISVLSKHLLHAGFKFKTTDHFDTRNPLNFLLVYDDKCRSLSPPPLPKH